MHKLLCFAFTKVGIFTEILSVLFYYYANMTLTDNWCIILDSVSKHCYESISL